MNDRKIDVIVALGVGVLIGSVYTARKWKRDYNELVDKHNRLIEVDRIKSRVFEEVLPQLPEDYTLSRKTMTDIQVVNMFKANDM